MHACTTWRAITYLCPADSLIECCRPLHLWQGAQYCASFNALTACWECILLSLDSQPSTRTAVLTGLSPGRRTGSQCTCAAGCQGPCPECGQPGQDLGHIDRMTQHLQGSKQVIEQAGMHAGLNSWQPWDNVLRTLHGICWACNVSSSMNVT